MSPPGLTADAVKQAFVLAEGRSAAMRRRVTGRGRVVFQVKEIVPAPAAHERAIRQAFEGAQAAARGRLSSRLHRRAQERSRREGQRGRARSASQAPARKANNEERFSLSTLPAKLGDMQVLPSLEAFSKRYKAGEAQVVWTRIVADLETPVSVYLKLAQGARSASCSNPSRAGVARALLGRGSRSPTSCGAPTARWRRSIISPLKKPKKFVREEKPTLESLRSLLAASAAQTYRRSCHRMAAGVFGYIGYDTVRLIEKLPDVERGRARRSRQRADAADAGRHFRFRQRRDQSRHAGPA